MALERKRKRQESPGALRAEAATKASSSSPLSTSNFGSCSALYSSIKSWQTRLLVLHPDSADKPSRARLIIVDLLRVDDGVVVHETQKVVQYEALSYAWGSAERSATLELNGVRISITTRLHDALKCLRYTNGERTLWVDALCINQEDKAEKSVQVRNIFSIFERAHRVVVWLGQEAKLTGTAIKYLRDQYLKQAHATRSKDRPLALYDAFRNLCVRPWTLRVWVQQEIFAAQDVIIQCGNRKLTLEEYKAAASAIPNDMLSKEERPERASLYAQRAEDNRAQHHCACPLVGQEDGLFRPQRPTQSTNPECILHYSTDLQASDMRDRLFALLGLSNCSIRKALPRVDSSLKATFYIDYSKSVGTVFQNFTKYVICRDHSLDILRHHVPTRNANSDLDLPSWCPNWMSFQGHSASNDDYSIVACDSRDAAHFSLSNIRDNEATLRISGVVIAVLLTSDNITNHDSKIQRCKIRFTGSHQHPVRQLPLVISRATHHDLLTILNHAPHESLQNTHFFWTCNYNGTTTAHLFPRYPRGGIMIPEVYVAVLRVLHWEDVLVRTFEGWFAILRKNGSGNWIYVGSASLPEGDDVDWPQAIWQDDTKWGDFDLY